MMIPRLNYNKMDDYAWILGDTQDKIRRKTRHQITQSSDFPICDYDDKVTDD